MRSQLRIAARNAGGRAARNAGGRAARNAGSRASRNVDARAAARATRLGPRLTALILTALLVATACAPAVQPAGTDRPSAPPKVALESAAPALGSGAPTPVPPGVQTPSAAPPSAIPGASIGDPVLVDERQLLTVLRAEEWYGHQPNPDARFVAVLVEVEGVIAAPYNANLFLVDTGEDRNRVASDGRKPRFTFGQDLGPGETYRGWLTFSVPFECQCDLLYALPLGHGQRSEPVRVRLDPITSPSDEPASTPKPSNPPNLAGIGPDFFGPDVRLSTYEITGRTPEQIEEAMATKGPRIGWLGRAAAVTQVLPAFDFVRRGSGASCRIVVTGEEPVDFEYRVVLPEWKTPSNASPATVDWWRTTLREIAVHERVHIEIYRDGLEVLNEVVRTSTCSNLQERLDEAWAEINLEQCEFDMREYGEELGLRLEDCLEELG